MDSLSRKFSPMKTCGPSAMLHSLANSTTGSYSDLKILSLFPLSLPSLGFNLSISYFCAEPRSVVSVVFPANYFTSEYYEKSYWINVGENKTWSFRSMASKIARVNSTNWTSFYTDLRSDHDLLYEGRTSRTICENKKLSTLIHEPVMS